MVPVNGLVEFFRSKVREESVGEVELGVGKLPEHEARKAGVVFASANEEVRIRQIFGV